MSENSGMDEEFGRYRLRGTLGTGGMGQVYRAYDTALGREVALKVLHARAATDPVLEERFRREARIAAALNEPHIVPIFDSGEIDNRLFISMPLIDGTDLGTLLREGALPPEQAVSLLEQAAAALDAAHEAGLEHRDIKPANLLITPKNFLYLIDFGIARAPGEDQLTSTGATVGTVAYIAPERFTAAETADQRADIYSLACVFYECLTGAKPYVGQSLEEQLWGHVHLPPPEPSRVNTDVPTEFDSVIAKGMATDPAQRFQTAAELAAAARAALHGQAVAVPVSHRQVPSPAPAARPAPREQTLEYTGVLSPDELLAPDTGEQVGPSTAPLPLPTTEPTRKRRRLIIALAAVLVAVLTVFASIVLYHDDSDVQPGAVVHPVKATVFSPGGDPDSPDKAERAIDGDPNTGWRTDTYTDAVPFPTFKPGIGLMLELPSPTKVATVSVRLPSTGTAIQIRSATSANPAALDDTTALTDPKTLQPGENTITVNASSPTSYLLVWISTLGTTGGQSKTELSEIVVHAAK